MNRLPSNETTSTATKLLYQVRGKIRPKHYSLRTGSLIPLGLDDLLRALTRPDLRPETPCIEHTAARVKCQMFRKVGIVRCSKTVKLGQQTT